MTSFLKNTDTGRHLHLPVKTHPKIDILTKWPKTVFFLSGNKRKKNIEVPAFA
jgi:hypothetical protein